MYIPKYWSSARGVCKNPKPRRRATLTRWGWSDTSQQDADQHAQERLREVMEQAQEQARQTPTLATLWNTLVRREPKTAYNGADGVPIREEVVDERLGAVVTRNGYGALCLNTDTVLFVDVDQEELARTPYGWFWPLTVLGLGLGMLVYTMLGVTFCGCDSGVAKGIKHGVLLTLSGFVGAFLVHGFVGWARRSVLKARGGAMGWAGRYLGDRVRAHPEEKWRLYQTPKGARGVALWKNFDAQDSFVDQVFKTSRADPLYAQMCRKQNCFRARVSPKPWNMGQERMGGPIWPVFDQALTKRHDWVKRYEKRERDFAACRFVKDIGAGRVDTDVLALVEWHDEMCQARSKKPLA